MLAVPEARAENDQQARTAQHEADAKRQALTPEQMQRRAQSRGLWTSGDEVPTAPTTHRSGTLPRAVVGTPTPSSAANTNFRNPSIGNPDSQPAQPLPLSAAAESAAPRAQSPAELSDGHTVSVRPGLAPEASLPPNGLDGDTAEIPLEQLRAKQALTEAARPASSPKAGHGSPPNTIVWLALILIAAIVAVWFIGAAIGMWSLPWGNSASGRSSLNKAIAAKSLPEMHAVAPQELAAPTLTALQPSAAAALAPAPEAEGAQPAAVVMEAEEAAPLRAPQLSSGNLDDLMDPPNPEVAPTLMAARTELRAGHPKEAEALLRPLLEKDPDDHHVGEALAQALLARGAAVEAVGVAQRIVKKFPKRASYRVLLGDALRRAGDEPSAKLAYKNALALDPKLRDAQRRLKNRKLVGTP